MGGAHEGLDQCTTTAGVCRLLWSFGWTSRTGHQSPGIDASKNLWVATTTGLYFARAGVARTFESVPFAGPNPQQFVAKVVVTQHEEILVAGSQGLSIGHNGRWRQITTSDGLLDDDVSQVASDGNGVIWVAYGKSLGITRLERSSTTGWKCKHYSLSNGLASDFVYSMTADRQGRVWVGTDVGVETFQGDRWYSYSTADGLIWNDNNTDAVLADSQGGIWFGTSKGLAHFQPNREHVADAAPVPLITNIQVARPQVGSAGFRGSHPIRQSRNRLGILRSFLPERVPNPVSVSNLRS